MRACAVCGSSLDGSRPQARFCSAGCRTEAWRIRRLVEGVPVGRYANLKEDLPPTVGRALNRHTKRRGGAYDRPVNQMGRHRANGPPPALEGEPPARPQIIGRHGSSLRVSTEGSL